MECTRFFPNTWNISCPWIFIAQRFHEIYLPWIWDFFHGKLIKFSQNELILPFFLMMVQWRCCNAVNWNENSWFWLNESPTWQQQFWNNLTILLWFHLTPSRRRVLNFESWIIHEVPKWGSTSLLRHRENDYSLSDIWTLGIQSPCQMMIRAYNHLRNARYLDSMKPFLRRWLYFYRWSQKKMGQTTMICCWVVRVGS